jgi:hypothetical protein
MPSCSGASLRSPCSRLGDTDRPHVPRKSAEVLQGAARRCEALRTTARRCERLRGAANDCEALRTACERLANDSEGVPNDMRSAPKAFRTNGGRRKPYGSPRVWGGKTSESITPGVMNSDRHVAQRMQQENYEIPGVTALKANCKKQSFTKKTGPQIWLHSGGFRV